MSGATSMIITPTNLFEAQFAPATDTIVFTAASKTILDSLTVTNIDTGSQAISVNIVASGGSVSSANLITAAFSITANTAVALPEAKYQVLNAGDFISVKAANASKVVVRANGRVLT